MCLPVVQLDVGGGCVTLSVISGLSTTVEQASHPVAYTAQGQPMTPTADPSASVVTTDWPAMCSVAILIHGIHITAAVRFGWLRRKLVRALAVAMAMEGGGTLDNKILQEAGAALDAMTDCMRDKTFTVDIHEW